MAIVYSPVRENDMPNFSKENINIFTYEGSDQKRVIYMYRKGHI